VTDNLLYNRGPAPFSCCAKIILIPLDRSQKVPKLILVFGLKEVEITKNIRQMNPASAPRVEKPISAISLLSSILIILVNLLLLGLIIS